MNRNQEISKPKRLFIEELEQPAIAAKQGPVTTLAVGEESGWWLITFKEGEDAVKGA
jgi:hypothetical protein